MKLCCSGPLPCLLIGIVLAIKIDTATLAFAPSRHFSKLHPSPIRYHSIEASTRKYAIAIPQQPAVDVVTADIFSENKENSQQTHRRNVAPADQWIVDLDYEGFGRDVSALRQELQSLGGIDDVQHMNKLVLWRNICAVIGLSTVWMTPNPITIVALSTWTYASWTMIAHHTCHGGYNRFTTTSNINSSNSSSTSSSFNSRGYAIGSVMQRCRDWLDWMLPEAWNVEHNRLHHYRLNEMYDPDLVQRNLHTIRENKMPMAFKYIAIAFVFPVWKWLYYAPNTFKELQINRWTQDGKVLPKKFDPHESVTVVNLLSFGEKYRALREVVKPFEFFTQVIGPFLLTRFVLLPLPLLFIPNIGLTLWHHAMWNVVLAEVLTNIHAYITIVTNHAGDDLYTFKDAVKPRSPSFYVRQIVGSANYITNYDDISDFCHGFLNYQIEHRTFRRFREIAQLQDLSLINFHLSSTVDVWPDLSMRQYQIGAPRLEALCHQYGVPYVRESVWKRLRKTMDIMVGKSSMRIFPTEYEPIRDKTAAVTWKTTNGAIDDE